MKEILKKVRKYEIEIRKFLNNSNQGNYSSVFKGTGLDFDDLRPYQYGDDYRAINWNITAKENKTFINTYKEEKEQSVFFILDVSNSQNIGNNKKNKLNISKEICSVLTLSAIRTNSQVGLICYSDKKELFINSKKGNSHGFHLINRLYNLKPTSLKTDLNMMIKYSMRVIKKKSLVIIISDLLEKEFMKSIKSINIKHDLIVLHLYDEIEKKIPKLGLIQLEENESKYKKWINTSSSKFQDLVKKTYSINPEKIKKEMHKIGITFLSINTKKNYVKDLIKLFKYRKLKR